MTTAAEIAAPEGQSITSSRAWPLFWAGLATAAMVEAALRLGDFAARLWGRGEPGAMFMAVVTCGLAALLLLQVTLVWAAGKRQKAGLDGALELGPRLMWMFVVAGIFRLVPFERAALLAISNGILIGIARKRMAWREPIPQPIVLAGQPKPRPRLTGLACTFCRQRSPELVVMRCGAICRECSRSTRSHTLHGTRHCSLCNRTLRRANTAMRPDATRLPVGAAPGLHGRFGVACLDCTEAAHSEFAEQAPPATVCRASP